jgi:hypothetical protein
VDTLTTGVPVTVRFVDVETLNTVPVFAVVLMLPVPKAKVLTVVPLLEKDVQVNIKLFISKVPNRRVEELEDVTLL